MRRQKTSDETFECATPSPKKARASAGFTSKNEMKLQCDSPFSSASSSASSPPKVSMMPLEFVASRRRKASDCSESSSVSSFDASLDISLEEREQPTPETADKEEDLSDDLRANNLFFLPSELRGLLRLLKKAEHDPDLAKMSYFAHSYRYVWIHGLGSPVVGRTDEERREILLNLRYLARYVCNDDPLIFPKLLLRIAEYDSLFEDFMKALKGVVEECSRFEKWEAGLEVAACTFVILFARVNLPSKIFLAKFLLEFYKTLDTSDRRSILLEDVEKLYFSIPRDRAHQVVREEFLKSITEIIPSIKNEDFLEFDFVNVGITIFDEHSPSVRVVLERFLAIVFACFVNRGSYLCARKLAKKLVNMLARSKKTENRASFGSICAILLQERLIHDHDFYNHFGASFIYLTPLDRAPMVRQKFVEAFDRKFEDAFFQSYRPGVQKVILEKIDAIGLCDEQVSLQKLAKNVLRNIPMGSTPWASLMYKEENKDPPPQPIPEPQPIKVVPIYNVAELEAEFQAFCLKVRDIGNVLPDEEPDTIDLDAIGLDDAFYEDDFEEEEQSEL
ncbi:hypothetical protein L596_018019 [Steinernema carpocapsae]|uniref:Uncharacterized protein n=1 Tax=Steinernema carpocapsae TaxID=34508 RepID=A0A4U5N464_STECR|nr:hypothetical protein L596_018019 [Steinernema carpocapsae]